MLMTPIQSSQNDLNRSGESLPGVGPALVTALVASVADPKAFRSGRDFSAWTGLVPKRHCRSSSRPISGW
jgi:transposase